MERRSVAGFLENFVRRGWETAYVSRRGYRGVRSAYRDVADAAFQFGRELDQRKIGKGDRVIIWGPNSAEWVVAFFGCALRGVVVVPLDDVAVADFAERVQWQVNAKLLVCSRQHALRSIPTLHLDDLFETVGRHPIRSYPPVDIASEDALEIVFTSGTTAEPKGVVITHRNVLANIAPLENEIRKYLKYERFVHPVRFLNLLPLSHVFGQFLGIFLPQLLGGTVIFQDALSPTEVIATVHRERVSVLVAVPRMLQSLKEKIERELKAEHRWEDFQRRFQRADGKHFLHRWWILRDIRHRFGWKFWAFICGGAALDRVTEVFWDRLGYAVVQGYGLTETTSLISVNHPFHLSKGSVGKVLGGREVKLGSDGEILVRGGGVASGYWSGGQLQPVASDEGWYRTGDIGELDAQGNLYFKGRKKDVIVTPAGMNVYPEDLEAALRGQAGVKDAAIIALPQDGNAEPCAVMILRDGAEAEPEVRRANESLAEYQRIHKWYVWPDDDFPRTSTHKPRTNVILQRVQAQFAGRNEPATGHAMGEFIRSVTGRALPNLSPTDSLETNLNLTSLDRVALLSAMEDRYQVDLSDTRFSSINTVADLGRALHGQAPPRVHYHYPRWVQRWPVTWIRFLTNHLLLLPSVLVLGWPRVEGREKLTGIEGPVLVVCNHIGDVDPGFVIAALPHRLRNKIAIATGGETLESYRTPAPRGSWLMGVYRRMQWLLAVSLLNLFPLPRQAGFRESFAYAGESLDRGYSVLVFPEGHHTTSGKLQPFRAGIGLLASSVRVPIIPMRIDGLFELKQAGKKFAWPHTIRVKIGRPVRFGRDADAGSITSELRNRVAEL